MFLQFMLLMNIFFNIGILISEINVKQRNDNDNVPESLLRKRNEILADIKPGGWTQT